MVICKAEKTQVRGSLIGKKHSFGQADLSLMGLLLIMLTTGIRNSLVQEQLQFAEHVQALSTPLVLTITIYLTIYRETEV